MSIMLDNDSDLNRRIGDRLRELRSERALSLDSLAGRSGVSRSMISLIERGESSPTAVVLDKLAAGLGVTLSSLFDSPGHCPVSPVARREDQPQWRDPATGYIRRNVSPPGAALQIAGVWFPPGERVVFETAGRQTRVHQQVWVLQGSMEITVGEERHQLREGDCLAMYLEGVTVFHNPGKMPARYAVVIAAEPLFKR